MKKKTNEKSKISPSKAKWYREPTSILAILSIIATTIVGFFSIWNNMAIAKLNRKVYVPKLQYSITQIEQGAISVNVSNTGSDPADNVSINITWGEADKLTNCQVLPPFQDTAPVTPMPNNNITYRVAALPSGSILTISCDIYNLNFAYVAGYSSLLGNPLRVNVFPLSNPTTASGLTPVPYNVTATPELIPFVPNGPRGTTGPLLIVVLPLDPGIYSTTTPGLIIVRSDVTPTPVQLSSIVYRGLKQVDLSQAIINIQILSDNSPPAIEIGNRPIVSEWVPYLVTTPSP